MSDLVDFIEFVDYARRYRDVGPRRYLRDYSDPFTKYSVGEFHARYRFTPESIKSVILPMLASDLRKPTKRGLPFAPEIMLLLTLRFFATGSFQVSIERCVVHYQWFLQCALFALLDNLKKYIESMSLTSVIRYNVAMHFCYRKWMEM